MALAQGAKVSPDNPAETERDRPQERARWFMRGRTLDGRPAAAQLHHAYNQKLSNRALHAQSVLQGAASGATPHPRYSPQPAGGPVWTALGPAPTATAAYNNSQQDYGPAIGRVTAVAVDQGDPSGNTVYVGGASGGLWRTTNAVSAPRTCNSNGVCTAPATWTPLTDGQASLTVGSIALQPGNSNLVLVGTGEANNSADSYYGLGILRSTDGGSTWTLISKTSDNAYDFHGLGFTHVAFSTVSPLNVVATAAAASAGVNLGAETGGPNVRGIYYSGNAGASWARATVSDGARAPDAGSANAVIYNPIRQKFYANIRYHGFYSSSNGATWTRLASQPPGLSLTACPSATNSSCPLYRAEMAIVPGRDEMYVWIIDNNDNDQGIYQTKDGGQTWTSISTAGIDTCGDGADSGCGTGSTSQGTYNISLAAVPSGTAATDLYAGGVNEYKCSLNPTSNPTCTSPRFLNLTHVYGCNPAGNIAHVHPDEHGIDFLGNDVTGAFFAAHPGYDPPVFFGNDGGIYRVLHDTSLSSGTCPASGAPPSPFDNLSASANFSMIQFVGFSHHPTDPATLVGGTQDNGSPGISGASPSEGSWLAVNNGDGGFNAINPLSPNEWFTSNPAPLTSGAGIQRCTSGISCTYQNFFSVVTQSKIGGDYSSFYTFFMLDPQASGRMIVGSCRVWRGNSDGTGSDWSVSGSGGNPLSFNLDTQVAASCGDPGVNPTTWMVNTIAAGGPCNGPCDPGITPASGTGGGSQVIWAGMEGIADSLSAQSQCPPGNGNGSPCGGQLWRTLAADSGPASWSEVSGLGGPNSGVSCASTPSACNINPRHFNISGIALDPGDPTGRTAYVTVMGFGVGHLFKTTDAGATWARLDGDPNGAGLPDAPANAAIAAVANPSVGVEIFVGADVGVFRSIGDGNWTELGPPSGAGSLPNVAVTQLKIYDNPADPIPLRLRASTYGRGLWEIPISPGPAYTMTVDNPNLFAFAGQTAAYTGNIATFNGYNSSINITCASGATAAPATCPSSGSPVTVPSPATSGSFSVVAGNPSVDDLSFNLSAVGTDPKSVSQVVPVAFHAVDFSLGALPPASVGAGDAADVSFTVTSQGQFTGDVTFACSGQPAGTSCHFSPAVASLSPGVPATVQLTIPTSASTAPGAYTVAVTGTATLGSATQSHPASQPLIMTVQSASQSFTVAAATPISPAIAKPGQPITASVNVTAGSGYAGTLALSCAFDPAAGSPGSSTCSMDPASVPLASTQTVALHPHH